MTNYIKRIILVVIVLLFLVLPLVKIKKINEWTCAYTGSQHGDTTWFWFIKTDEWYHASALEKWEVDKKRTVEHSWRRTRGTNYSLFSSRADIAIYPPPIYYLIIVPGLDQKFVDTSTEKQITLLLNILKNGTRYEQEKVLKKIFEIMKRRTKGHS